jgi:hypothetical protein
MTKNELRTDKLMMKMANAKAEMGRDS